MVQSHHRAALAVDKQSHQETRRSEIVYVVARLKAEDDEYFLFHRHPKWGDWGLVGGHVEEDERHDWTLAARRETDEEMEPLRVGADLRLRAIPQGPECWGPVPSKSAGGRPTIYAARWYSLAFESNPEELLARLPAGEFLLVARERLEAQRDRDITSLLERLADALPGGFDDISLAWGGNLQLSGLPTRR